MTEQYQYFMPEQISARKYQLLDVNGNDVYEQMKELGLWPTRVSQAVKAGQALRLDKASNRFRRVDKQLYFEASQSVPTDVSEQPAVEETADTHEEIINYIHNVSASKKPDMLLMPDLRWKYLIRSVIRSQNVLMTGPTGSGKTMTVKWLAEALDRPLFSFNLGATQDARASLIGNTHFDNGKGTYFAESPFIKAVQTPNAIVLLDELSRANPEAMNILMTVLDKNQRYVRIDESADTPTVAVHPTVTFVGTANVGVEYSSTRVIDRALLDRFVPINMDYLDEAGEQTLLTKFFPQVSADTINKIAKIVTSVRADVKAEDSRLSNNLSTRHSIELTALINDGFNLEEAAELIIYPQYSDEGGMDSELVYVKQLVQAQLGEQPEDEQPADSERELFESVTF